MTADSKAKDYHWFQMYAIRNRVDAGIIMNIYVIVIVRLVCDMAQTQHEAR